MNNAPQSDKQGVTPAHLLNLGNLPAPQSSKLDDTIDNLIAYVINEQGPTQNARHKAKSQIKAIMLETYARAGERYVAIPNEKFDEAFEKEVNAL